MQYTCLFLLTQDYDCKVFSEYCLSVINEYRIEYLAEVYRQRNFPKYQSRLSAVFAFGDYNSCIKADKKYHWNLSTVRKIKLFDSPYNRIIKANSEIISFFRRVFRISSIDQMNSNYIWESYWKGCGAIHLKLMDATLQRNIHNSGEIIE